VNRIEIIELVQQHHPHMAEVEILKLINRAMDDFCIRTECLKKIKLVSTTTAGVRYYTIAGMIKVINVWLDDVLMPRIVSKDEAMLIDDDEHENPTNQLPTPTAVSKDRYWYVINDMATSGLKIGLVEKSVNTVNRHDITSDYQSISETDLPIKAHFIGKATHLTSGSDSSVTFTPEINEEYHPALVSKAIADGYKDIRNQKFDAAQFFTMEYEDYVKKAKKQSRSGNIVTGHVVPHTF